MYFFECRDKMYPDILYFIKFSKGEPIPNKLKSEGW